MAMAYSEISRRMGSRVFAVVDLTAATESAAAVRVRLATRFIASTNWPVPGVFEWVDLGSAFASSP